MTEAGSLSAVLRDAAAGRFPPADGGVTILPQPSPRDAGILGFTAHAVIFTDADPGWVAGQLPPGDLGAPLNSAFVQALCGATDRVAGSIDLLCVAERLPGPPPVDLVPEPDRAHPRIERALSYRDGVRAWRADGGVVLLGQGRGRPVGDRDRGRRRPARARPRPGAGPGGQASRARGRTAVGAGRPRQRRQRAGIPGRRVHAGGRGSPARRGPPGAGRMTAGVPASGPARAHLRDATIEA